MQQLNAVDECGPGLGLAPRYATSQLVLLPPNHMPLQSRLGKSNTRPGLLTMERIIIEQCDFGLPAHPRGYGDSILLDFKKEKGKVDVQNDRNHFRTLKRLSSKALAIGEGWGMYYTRRVESTLQFVSFHQGGPVPSCPRFAR